MAAHPAAYWVLTRRSKRAAAGDSGGDDGQRLPYLPMVGDVLREYPYAANEPCPLCRTLLSRYNPNVICFRCIEQAYRDGSAVSDRRFCRLLRKRRPLNPDYITVDASFFDGRFIRRGRSRKNRTRSRGYGGE